ncbi:MAG: Cof-type HAD-IIB family hydrolase [Oscillospiraceae bacterium]
MIRALSDILVLSDMDGTLLNTEKKLLAGNLQTIRLFTAMGGRFAIATGRVSESVSRYKELLSSLSPSITSGGCILYDFKSQKAVKSALLPPLPAQKAMDEIIRLFPALGVVIMAGNGRVYQLQASLQTRTLFCDEKITYFVRPRQDLPPNWNKVLFAGPAHVLEEVENYVSMQHYPGIYFVATDRNYFEMMPQGVSKGSALESLCEVMNIPLDNTIAIGDYYNDIDIMRKAGHSVAMANAPREIQILADETTAGCNECGVGQYLYKLIKQYEKK